MAHDWSGNDAPDGYYVDLYDNSVRQLQTAYGFDKTAFEANVPTTVYTATALTSAAIQAAINAANAAGGGIVRLPAGSGNISTQITLSSDILLEGAGSNDTLLTWTGTAGFPFFAKDKRHIVLRDFYLDAQNEPVYAVNFEYCDNVMVERTDVRRGKNGNLRCRFVDGVTFRFNTLRDCRDYHGIAIKDIFENGALRDEAYCLIQFNSYSSTYGSLFTRSIAIYSNNCHGNGGNGINCHGINGEICGNNSHDNAFGGKSYDGNNVILHHNTFEDNAGRGWATSATIEYTGRTVGNLVFCSNRFINNGATDLGIYDYGAYGTWTYTGTVLLKNNTYTPTGSKTNIVSGPGSTVVKVCSGSSDTSATWSGSYGTADADYCGGCGGTVTVTPSIGCDSTTILSNGDFSDGIVDWELSTDGTVEIDASGGALIATVTDWGTATEINQAPLSVTNATEYELQVLIAADAPTSVGVQLVNNTTPATGRGLDATINVGTTAAIYSAQFTANATDTDARLRFNISDEVTLTIYEVCLRPVASGTITANFTQSTTSGTAPLMVNFTDLSVADNTITAWTWRANGTVFSTSQNPSYTFTAAGTYSIRLAVTSSDGTDIVLKENLITVTSSSSSGSGVTSSNMSVEVPGGSSDFERRASGYDLSLSGLRINTGGSIGVRFVLADDIPAGATITSAVLTLGMLGPAPTTYPTITISGQQASNAAVFSDSTDYDARTWTTATVDWTPSTWSVGATVDLPGIAAIVQELVDDYSGLSSGDGIAFKLAHGGSGDLLKVASYETGTQIPALYIAWDTSGGASEDTFGGTQTVQITASANDCERRTSGFDLARAGLRIYPDAGAVAGCGLRFILGQDIPANATIDSASIDIWGLDVGSTVNDVTVRCESSAAPAAFSDDTDYDARTQSTTNVTWNAGTWTVGDWMTTSDISTLMQELVDNYGPLSAGTPVVFFLNNEAATAGYMKFSSYETAPAQAPRLTIDWTVPTNRVLLKEIGQSLRFGLRSGLGV